MVLHKTITKLLLAVVLVTSACALNAITITSEDQLIEEIKQLRNSFENFDAIQNYIDEHCGHLKNSVGIKSAIKNQFQYFNRWYILVGGLLSVVPFFLTLPTVFSPLLLPITGPICAVSGYMLFYKTIPTIIKLWRLKRLYGSFVAGMIDSELLITFEN